MKGFGLQVLALVLSEVFPEEGLYLSCTFLGQAATSNTGCGCTALSSKLSSSMFSSPLGWPFTSGDSSSASPSLYEVYFIPNRHQFCHLSFFANHIITAAAIYLPVKATFANMMSWGAASSARERSRQVIHVIWQGHAHGATAVNSPPPPEDCPIYLRWPYLCSAFKTKQKTHKSTSLSTFTSVKLNITVVLCNFNTFSHITF